MTPFGIPSASEFLLDPPPALWSNEYAKAYNEVKTVGSASANSTERPPDRANVVLFYQASSPTFVFNQAARQIVAQEGRRSLSENARAFALINMAINDGAIASFFNKYHYNFWRPETAIHAGDTDGNPKTEADPKWVPFIPAPCFPGYPSNHGSLSNAGAEVMRRLYGEAGHAITLSNPAVPTIVLHYGSLGRLPTTSPTLAFTAGYISEPTRMQERVWAELSAPQSTRSTCVLCTIMAWMMTGMISDDQLENDTPFGSSGPVIVRSTSRA